MNRFFKKVTALGLSAAAALSLTMCSVSAAWTQTAGRWSYTEGSSLVTGWKKIDNIWYYFNGSGIMQTGWQKIDGVWYYFKASGAMQTGWAKIDGCWYLFNGGGAMKTGWAQSGGYWYFLGGGGDMKTGWVKTGGHWYYMDGDGRMQTGWLTLNGKRYYLDGNGAMVTGTAVIDGESYTFTSDGELTEEETPSQTPSADVSAIAKDVLSQINSARRKEGLSALTLSDKLGTVAQARAVEQAVMGNISHSRPDGSEWYTILAEYHMPATGCGENLAMNYTSASAVVKAWLESSVHKANIMNVHYQYMGIGYYEENGNIYWVQLFSTSN